MADRLRYSVQGVRAGLPATSARSSTDRASDYGSEGWGFESLRARFICAGQRPGARFYVRHLHEWLRPPALRAETSMERVLVEASRVDLGAVDGAFGRLELRREVHYSFGERRAEITSDVACAARFTDPVPWLKTLRPISALCDLVTFATGRVGTADGVYLTLPGDLPHGESLELILRTVELRRDPDPETFLIEGDCVLLPHAWKDCRQCSAPGSACGTSTRPS
jgi:hypothetical protein